MAEKNIKILNENGDTFLPFTDSSIVRFDNTNIKAKIQEAEKKLNETFQCANNFTLFKKGISDIVGNPITSNLTNEETFNDFNILKKTMVENLKSKNVSMDIGNSFLNLINGIKNISLNKIETYNGLQRDYNKGSTIKVQTKQRPVIVQFSKAYCIDGTWEVEREDEFERRSILIDDKVISMLNLDMSCITSDCSLNNIKILDDGFQWVCSHDFHCYVQYNILCFPH